MAYLNQHAQLTTAKSIKEKGNAAREEEIEKPTALSAKETLTNLLQSLPTTTLRDIAAHVTESLAEDTIKFRSKKAAAEGMFSTLEKLGKGDDKAKAKNKAPRSLRIKIKCQVPDILKENAEEQQNVIRVEQLVTQF